MTPCTENSLSFLYLKFLSSLLIISLLYRVDANIALTKNLMFNFDQTICLVQS